MLHQRVSRPPDPPRGLKQYALGRWPKHQRHRPDDCAQIRPRSSRSSTRIESPQAGREQINGVSNGEALALDPAMQPRDDHCHRGTADQAQPERWVKRELVVALPGTHLVFRILLQKREGSHSDCEAATRGCGSGQGSLSPQAVLPVHRRRQSAGRAETASACASCPPAPDSPEQ